ncbi:hypothetical protein AS189_09440 [Arthrobacter alpinus]|uniref:CAAX prenyl protease 2/Lysostaphin resistance protein A-like domain-containing protein n=1 Tax=Arthrobacter alpinus TaxID=656366 RepID=A0A0S2LZ05_9MICC|nr:hypothetical protein AS189_09440 [Arthrobacter alpinus]
MALVFIVVSPLLVMALQLGSNKDAMSNGDLKYGVRKTVRVFRSVAIALGVRKYTRSEISQLLVICVATITVFVALNNWLSHLPLPAGWAASPDDDRLLAIAQATPFIQAVHGFFHAPLWEETLFRGPIALAVFAVNSGATRRYLNKTLGLVILVVISLVSTLTFGLAHAPYNGLNVVLAGGFGAVAAVTTIRYRSILPGVLIHAFYNAMVQIA